jgi:hypothetical protein
MTKHTKSLNSKHLFLLLLLVLIGGAVWYVYLFIDTTITKRLIVHNQTQVAQEQAAIAAFSAIAGFDKLQFVEDLEHNNYQMPWSDHIEAVIHIFDAVLNVDTAESKNIVLSDFKISLDHISVKGYVSNLRILYNSPDPTKKTALIDRFEQLDFLEDISIKTYQKAADQFGYDFILTANVINDDTK